MPRGAQRDDRFHRHVGAVAEQLQRAVGGLHGGGALRVPHAGRRRYPAERRLPEAADGNHARRLDAQSALSGGGGRRVTSRPRQCITNALYGALGVMASSQGTMNNFTFGNARYQYYETICGGSGAGNGFERRRRGADAYDQFAPDRSRSARMALSGAARIAMIRAESGGADAGTEVTGRSGACAFSSR